MKILIFILSMMIGVAYGQGGWTRPNNSHGTIQNGISVDSAMGFPAGCGSPTSMAGINKYTKPIKKPNQYLDTCNHRFYFYDPARDSWDTIHAGSGVSTNIYNNDGTLITDRTLSGGDTHSLEFIELTRMLFSATGNLSNTSNFVLGDSAYFSSGNSGNTHKSEIILHPDSIVIHPPQGVLYIDSLVAGSSSGDSVLVKSGSQIKTRAQSSIAANAWSITGNSGTTGGTNFIGTTDATDFIFKRNNIWAGRIGNSNTSFGKTALDSVTTGANNNAFGVSALAANTSANSNNAFGNGSLIVNTTGATNSAFGNGSLSGITTGSLNNGFGSGTLLNITSGNYNTAIGSGASPIANRANTITIGYLAKTGCDSCASYGDTSANIKHGFGTAYPTTRVDIRGQLKVKDGTEATGNIFVSDANGIGSWVAPSNIGTANIYNTDGVLGGNRTVSGNQNELDFSNNSLFHAQSLTNNVNNYLSLFSENSALGAANIISMHASTITVSTDSISFLPGNGRINIDSLRSTSSTTRKNVMMWDTVGGEVYGVPISSMVPNTITPQPFGVIYDNSSFTNTSDFLDSGGVSPTVSAGEIAFVNGGSTFNKTLSITQNTLMYRYTMTAKVKVTGSNNGIFIGIRSSNNYVSVDSYGKILLDGSGNNGQISIIGYNDATAATGTTKLTVSTNDVLYLTYERKGNVVSFSVRNGTTNSAIVAVSYTEASTTVQPNTGRFSLGGLSATANFKLDSLNITSNDVKRPYLMAIGDSKTMGYAASKVSNSWAFKLSQAFPSFEYQAGAGDRTVDVLKRLPVIDSLYPQNALLNIGRNDIANGIDSGTIKTNYSFIVTNLKTNGANVYHVLPFFETNTAQTWFVNWIMRTYSTDSIIYTYIPTMPSNCLSADAIHPSDTGHLVIYNTIINAFKLKSNVPYVDSSAFVTSSDLGAYIPIAGTTTVTGAKTFQTTTQIASGLSGTPSLAFSANSAIGFYKHASANETVAVTSSTGATFGIQNTNSSGLSALEFYDNSGTSIASAGYTNGGSGEFRINNVASSAYMDFKISSTSALRINNNRTITAAVYGAGIGQFDGSGNLSSSTVLANGTTATTQSAGDNSTKVATTAYVNNATITLANGSGTTINGTNKIDLGGTLTSTDVIFGNSLYGTAFSNHISFQVSDSAGDNRIDMASTLSGTQRTQLLSGKKQGRQSFLTIKPDSLQLQPSLGNIYIDSLNNSASQYVLHWNKTTGAVTYADTTASTSASPSGNYGDVQLNRNTSFATPASDSLQFSAGLIVKGFLSVTTTAAITTSVTSPLLLGGTGTGSTLSLQSTSGVGATDAINFKVGNNGATTAMTILTGGQIGIGTASPSTYAGFGILNINGSSGGLIETKIGGTIALQIYNDGNGSVVNELRGGKYLDLQVSNASYIRMSGSKVGIFTTSPDSALTLIGSSHISGNSRFEGTITMTDGANKSVGQATLVGGTVTVSNTRVTASSRIFLTDATTGSLVNIGTPTVGTIVAGTSFVINSSNVLDTSNINWLIIN